MNISGTRLIAVTPGEPAGIGPDITLQLACRQQDYRMLAIADPELMRARAKTLGLDIKIKPVATITDSAALPQAGVLEVLPTSLAVRAQAGELNPANARYVLQCLETAAALCKTQQVAAMVTGPVHKGIINDAGINFTGHTEFLAELSHSRTVMMLATKTLRVALATTHLALRDVSAAINTDTIEYCLTTLHTFLQNNCRISQPHILVCGLNPHAGEGGHLGDEEIDIIQPVIARLVARGMNITGPLPADTLFTEKYLRTADAVLAMYHDQGLPVLKYSGFGKAVNITLGLPFIRTSVDHGTALELAGTGNANSDSLNEAIKMAIALCK